eukprot:5174878-Pleurochrysis_carterae.AAC.5
MEPRAFRHVHEGRVDQTGAVRSECCALAPGGASARGGARAPWRAGRRARGRRRRRRREASSRRARDGGDQRAC